jgi:hypothetical protein
MGHFLSVNNTEIKLIAKLNPYALLKIIDTKLLATFGFKKALKKYINAKDENPTKRMEFDLLGRKICIQSPIKKSYY